MIFLLKRWGVLKMAKKLKKVKKGILGIRYSSGLALWTAIFAIFFEAISGVLLVFSLWAQEGIIISQGARGIFLTIATALLIIVAFLVALDLFTPLYEFLPLALKVFESFMLVLLMFGAIFIQAYYETTESFYYQNAFAATIIFFIAFAIFYLNYVMRFRKISIIEAHKNAINKLNAIVVRASDTLKDKRLLESLLEVNNLVNLTLNDIVSREIAERGDVSRILYIATIFAGAFYLGSFLLIEYGALISPTVIVFMYITIVLVALFSLAVDAFVLRAKLITSA